MDKTSLADDHLAYCSADNRAGLATYFLAQGELRLLKGDLAGLDDFEKATELDPCNPELFYRQGLALFEYGSEEGKEKALLLAGKKFKTAVNLCPEYFDAWQAWGISLSLLGMTYDEHHYFLEAEEKLKKAISFASAKSKDILSELQWDYGVVWTKMAVHSGEAVDLQHALDAFEKSSRYLDNLPSEFWIDFGKACMEMSHLINDARLTIKAINCFKYAISLSISCFEGWVHLAGAMQALYLQTHEEDHFLQASECFATAAHLKPYDTELWLEWATFLCASGKTTRDLKRLRSCLEKCQRSYAYNPRQPRLLAIWAEALSFIGEITERVDLIHEAQNKISEAVELSEEEDPEVWHSYGVCLGAFGRYFSDIEYHLQAIEKFQFGLSIDRTCHQHWFAIAKTYMVIGQMESDLESFEKAIRFFAKALDLHASSQYIFEYAYALLNLGDLKDDQKLLEESTARFEQALALQKNALYIHPDWLFHYATALDLLADFYEDESYYTRSIEILSHVLMIDPDFPAIHHRLALAFSHLGELVDDLEHFYRATHHFRLAAKHEEENDQVILDWGVCLINLGQHTQHHGEADQFYREADAKITQAAKLGNLQAYYHLGCLYSILGQYERAMHFIEKSHTVESLPPIEEVMEDEWLDGLRATPHFQQFLSHFER